MLAEEAGFGQRPMTRKSGLAARPLNSYGPASPLNIS
jgi:hypothetical protein